ncbi:unnamed protein product [Gongylonema pulchrum]|uniref:50S ribosomal protein L16 n=1 Tax=Gongylonema pulchrum TaxID=637853 RepID=A0A183DTZ1_9BILA|nr:unnamed protein product [Gongylonema pulchrum]
MTKSLRGVLRRSLCKRRRSRFGRGVLQSFAHYDIKPGQRCALFEEIGMRAAISVAPVALARFATDRWVAIVAVS